MLYSFHRSPWLAMAVSLFTLPLAQAQNTTEAPLLIGLGDWETSPVFTVGETITGWTPPGIMDGIGARRVGSTVEVFVNHELSEHQGATYTLQNGLALKGARITKFTFNTASREILSAGLAYARIYDRTGALVTSATQINEGSNTVNGIDRLCSASLFKAGTYNLVDDLFITGEETTNGQAFVLDVSNADLYCAPWLGRAKWENGTFLQPSSASQVAMLIGDDTGGAPLYLYIGNKGHLGDNSFLDRNGLAHGTLHVFVAANGHLSPQHIHGTGTQFSGSFQPIAHYNAALAGTTGYDVLGFATQNRQYTLGNAIGMFRFSRPEDVATDPNDPTRAVFASTGRGSMYPADDIGTTYIINIDFSDLSAEIDIVYDGDDAGDGQFTHPDHGLRSPDNLEWARDGNIYIQEDRTTELSVYGAVSGMETSIWKLDPVTTLLERIAIVDRTASLPAYQFDNDPGDLGNWETSGIVDVSEQFDAVDETLFLAVVQAHSTHGGNVGMLNLIEGGQMLFITGPENSIKLSMRSHLGGAYESSTGLMRDDLRSNGLIPLQHPYSGAPFGYPGTETIATSVLGITGNNAIVDWVLVELRDANDPTIILHRRAALVQRDGDIVDLNGTAPLEFKGAALGDYYVALRHRNHLGVMTADTHTLGATPLALDLGLLSTPTYGTNAQKTVFDVRMLWAGDVNSDGLIKYSGGSNDRDPILLHIGGVIPTNTTTGYHKEDLDMNGVVRYTGSQNDRDIILQSIGGVIPTQQRTQQLP